MIYLKKHLKKIGPLLRTVRAVKSIGYAFLTKNPYRKIRIKLEKLDKKNVLLRPELLPLHKKLNELKHAQIKNWNSLVYCGGYYYQGFDLIGISGIKPTERRIKNYEIESFLLKTKTVLDIGCNSGFLSCYVSFFVKEIDGIEFNPYLEKMGEEVKHYLGIKNAHFINDNFIFYQFSKTYDIIFSLSNHYTTDGNLNMDFESYIDKIYNLLNKDGILFFESHNINDGDKDLDKKFYIASKYFKLVSYKMVKAFYSADIDKLFAIFIRLDKLNEPQYLNFDLNVAKHKYQY